VPRDKRPSLRELEDYTESRYGPDTDYSAYRRELSIWLNDYNRDEEAKRLEQSTGRTPLYGHGDAEDEHQQRFGYEEDPHLDLDEVTRTIKKRPLH
jgi:hypothetical protein